MARTLPGVRPIISRASSPTATRRLSSSEIATTDGSLRTTPLPLTYTRMLAVPRSMPIFMRALSVLCGLAGGPKYTEPAWPDLSTIGGGGFRVLPPTAVLPQPERENSHMKLRVLWILVVAILSSCAVPASEGTSAPATPTSSDFGPSQFPVSSAEPTASPEASTLPSGLYGPVWELDPATAFQEPASCENLAGAPTMEFGPNVAWRVSYPSDWSA